MTVIVACAVFVLDITPAEVTRRRQDLHNQFVTLKQPGLPPLCPSVFVTVTVRGPMAALGLTLILTVSCVEPLTVTVCTVTRAPKSADAPLLNPVPVTTTD